MAARQQYVEITLQYIVSLSFLTAFKRSGMLFYMLGIKIFGNDQKSSTVLPCACRIREQSIIVGRFLMLSAACFLVGI